MANFQLVRHDLIGMFPVSLSQILMQHNAMHNRQTAIHAIDQQEDQPSNIARLHNHIPQQEQHDKRNTNRPDIASKALRLTLRTEIKDAEHDRRNNRSKDQRLLNELTINIYSR